MAGRKLTPEEKAEFAKRNALSKQANAEAKAKAAGVDVEATKAKAKANARSFEQIMADIEKVKSDPAFQKRMQAQGTQKGHTVTSRGNSTRRAGSVGGSIGDIGGGGMNWETK